MSLHLSPWIATSLCMLYIDDLRIGVFVAVLLFLTLYFLTRRARGVLPEPSDVAPGRVMLLAVLGLFVMNAFVRVLDLIPVAASSAQDVPEIFFAPPPPAATGEAGMSGWKYIATQPFEVLRALLLIALVYAVVGAFFLLASILPGVFALRVAKVYDAYANAGSDYTSES